MKTSFDLFCKQVNDALKRNYHHSLKKLEIEVLKRDWQEYKNADECAKDVVMIREYEEMMLQKYYDSMEETYGNLDKTA